MFDELKPYKKQGHFFFKSEMDLRSVSKDVPDLPGVYIIYRLANDNVDLVYIGKSGTIQQNGRFKEQGLRGSINKHLDYFDMKCRKEKIDALDIYWYVTVDENTNDLPGFVEGLLMQRFFEVYGCLPEWNKDY